MTGDNGLVPIKVFASEAEDYYDENFEDNTIYPTGHEPQQSLPATWYNTLMRNLTAQAQATYSLCTSMFEELKYVIEQSGQILDSTKYTQLAQAINKLSELQVATDSVLGGVKSSAADWKVLVNSDATMSVNTTTASTTVKGLTTLVDNCTTSDSTKAATAKAVKTAYDRGSTGVTNAASAQTAATNANTNANNKQLDSVSVGVSTNTLTVKVKNVGGTEKSDTTSVVTAASLSKPSTNTMQVSVNGVTGTAQTIVSSVSGSVSGSTLTISINGVSAEIDLSTLSPDSVTRATYAQYLVNSTSPSGTNYVTADTSKNISGHTLTLS